MARGKYKRKRERRLQQIMTINMLGLSARVLHLLEKNGILTIADLIRYSEADLISLPGIGPTAVEEIRAGLKNQNINW